MNLHVDSIGELEGSAPSLPCVALVRPLLIGGNDRALPSKMKLS